MSGVIKLAQSPAEDKFCCQFIWEISVLSAGMEIHARQTLVATLLAASCYTYWSQAPYLISHFAHNEKCKLDCFFFPKIWQSQVQFDLVESSAITPLPSKTNVMQFNSSRSRLQCLKGPQSATLLFLFSCESLAIPLYLERVETKEITLKLQIKDN